MDVVRDSAYRTELLPTFGADPASARARLVRELDAFEALWPALQPRWETPPREGAWSPAQVVEHALKAATTFSKVIYLLRRDAPIPQVPRVPGTVVDGRARAPEGLVPGAAQPLSALEPAWREMRARLLEEVDKTTDWHSRSFYHLYFGDLDALGWLQVAAWHLWHHRRGLERP